MADYILIDGDEAEFLPPFPPAVVTVKKGTIEASGPATFDGTKLCVEGDESSVKVDNCDYMTPQYSMKQGSGTLKITQLGPDQTAQKTNTGGKAVLLKGTTFDAEFEVTVPALQPPPGPGSPIPDGTKTYSGGKGMFNNKGNKKFQGS